MYWSLNERLTTGTNYRCRGQGLYKSLKMFQSRYLKFVTSLAIQYFSSTATGWSFVKTQVLKRRRIRNSPLNTMHPITTRWQNFLIYGTTVLKALRGSSQVAWFHWRGYNMVTVWGLVRMQVSQVQSSSSGFSVHSWSKGRIQGGEPCHSLFSTWWTLIVWSMKYHSPSWTEIWGPKMPVMEVSSVFLSGTRRSRASPNYIQKHPLRKLWR